MVRYVSAYVQYNQAHQKLKRVELETDSFTPDVIIATVGATDTEFLFCFS